MTKKLPTYLKLHVEEPQALVEPQVEEFPELANLCRSFQQATSWRLRYVSDEAEARKKGLWSVALNYGQQSSEAGSLIIEAPNDNSPAGDAAISLQDAQPLAESIRQLLQELARTRHVLWQREAELAAGVPITPRDDEEAHLAERLESVLQSGAEAVGCKAAAAYLLDDDTSELKMRACWGLPKERLLEQARPLRGAAADLEALVGHVVAIEDTSMLPHWKVPEEFASAVCIPISSPSMPLGTLWLFDDKPRDFTEHQTNLLEIVAGRLAADLEREILLQEGVKSKQADQQISRAAQWQDDRLPRIEPVIDGWNMAAWNLQAKGVGGDFYDWGVLPDGSLSLAVGDAQGVMIEAGLTAAMIHASMKAHSCYPHNSKKMLQRVNENLWTNSAGDQFGSLFYGIVDPDSGKLEYSLAGHAGAVILRATKHDGIYYESPSLGVDPDSDFQGQRKKLNPGDVLLVLSEGICKALHAQDIRSAETMLAKKLRSYRDRSPKELIDHVRELIGGTEADAEDDYTVLILKRRK